MNFIFEWDEDKAEKNLLNHKVSFDEAKTVTEIDNKIRIFSARESTKMEKKNYEESIR